MSTESFQDIKRNFPKVGYTYTLDGEIFEVKVLSRSIGTSPCIFKIVDDTGTERSVYASRLFRTRESARNYLMEELEALERGACLKLEDAQRDWDRIQMAEVRAEG